MELDPSVLEIAGEDDALVQHNPTPANYYYFACSPVQIPGPSRNPDRARLSPFLGSNDNVNVEKSTCSSPGSSMNSNKENLNANKSEVPKLSMEAQQMKRKKRGGAYNLRKSLAWDRAFFTEEGVLDPLELSILSGSFGNSSSEVMPTIPEEGRKVSSNSGSTSDSTDMQGTPKILSNQKSSRTGSKGGGCPRPLVYSSLKRPANASTIKAAMKESKLPKLPVSRPGSHSILKSSKSNVLSTSHSKHNRIDLADISQKSCGLQESKKTKNSANKANSGSVSSIMARKSSCPPPRRNMANGALASRPSTDPQPTLAVTAKRGLDTFPAAVLPPSGTHAPDSHHVSSKSGIPTTKPSGLRMPSPSLGFFGQARSSASNSSSAKATLPGKIPESCTPRLQRINTSNYAHDPRLPCARAKMPKMDINSTFCGNARISDLSKESVPSSGKDTSGEKGRLKLEGNNEAMKYQPMKENKEMHNFLDENKGFQEYREAHLYNSFCEGSGFELNDTNRLLQSRSCRRVKGTEMNSLESACFSSQFSCVELTKGDTKINNTITHQHIEDEPCSFGVGTHAVIFESHSDSVAGDKKQNFVVLQNDNSNDAHDDGECSAKKVEPTEATSSKADRSLYRENSNPMSNDGISLETRTTFDSQRYQSEDIEYVNLSIRETRGSEKPSSKSPPLDSAANESAAAADLSNQKLHVENCDWYSDTPFEPDLSLMKSRDHLAVDVTYSDSTICCSLSIEEDGGANVLKKNISAEKAYEGIKINGDSLVHGSRAINEFHSGDIGNSADVSLINSNSSGNEMEKCQYASQGYPEQAHEDAAGSDKITDGLCPEDTEVHSLDDILLVGISNSCHSNSEMDCQSLMAISDVNEQSTGLPDLQMPSLVAHKDSQYNHGLCSNDNSLHGKVTPQEEHVLAKVPSIAEQNADDGSESKSFSAAIQVPLSDSDVDMVEKCQYASQGYPEQAHEDAAGSDKITDRLCPEDTEVHSLDGNLLVGISNSCHSNSEMDCQSLMAISDVNEQSTGLPDMQMPSLVVYKDSQYNHGLCSNDNSLHGKVTSSDAPQEEHVLAKVPSVAEQNADDGSESKSFSAAIQVPLSDSDVDMVGAAEDQLLEHAPSSPADDEASRENTNHSIDSGLGYDGSFTGEATSLESELAVMVGDDGQAIGKSANGKAICLREESGFADQQIQNLGNETEILDPGVETENVLLPDDTGVEISQTKNSPTSTVIHQKMDTAICNAEHGDRAVHIKKSSGSGKQNHLMIKPPTNAVPFSDEWLAAMEAAGEDVLKMKSGAVQNSPPDRCLREPGPWSPVKRKNAEIGPYDCTKFNIPPSDSD